MIVTVALLALYVFQSTHPLRGATASGVDLAVMADISIHAPLAGCDLHLAVWHHKDGISIHAPLAGCDLWLNFGLCINCLFQSTHPLRGATVQTVCAKAIDAISIHAPLAGCDNTCMCLRLRGDHFNPRTPCGVRLSAASYLSKFHHFNPRTPCGVRLR